MTPEESAFINMINSDSVNGHYAQPVAAALYEQMLDERAGFVKLVGEMKTALKSAKDEADILREGMKNHAEESAKKLTKRNKKNAKGS